MKHFALAGNPNCGKTTLFNALTGSTAHVGNWPGVTVDKREGTYKKGSEAVSIVDLPGIYSLSPYTPEEVISRNYICDEKPECVINIVDATNLERNLYLTTQILEMKVPVVIALNMIDVIEKNGDKIDPKAIEEKLGVPVVCVSAFKGTNIDELMEVAIKASDKEREAYSVLDESSLGSVIKDVTTEFEKNGVDNPLFHAIKFIENDELEVKNHENLASVVESFRKNYNDKVFGNDLEAVVADSRYRYITKYLSKAKIKNPDAKNVMTKTEKADRVLTNKWAAIPIFLVILFLIFHLTFSENLFYLGGAINFSHPSFEGTMFEGLFFTEAGINSPGVFLQTFVTCITDALSGVVAGWLENAPGWISGLLVDGCLAGVFSVMSFIPQILLLFLFFSILEDTGYMARIAFILDRIFRKFGLSGRAFMPMIMGFGCSVPAMINTRTLADENERTATVRVIPFFSCGAKLPILTAIAGVICVVFGFPNVDIITYLMYIVGILTAIITIILMRRTSMRGDVSPFIMELPQYHAPSVMALIIHLWDKLKHYIQKAFTIILASTIVIWFLQSFTWSFKYIEMADPVGIADDKYAELIEENEYKTLIGSLDSEYIDEDGNVCVELSDLVSAYNEAEETDKVAYEALLNKIFASATDDYNAITTEDGYLTTSNSILAGVGKVITPLCTPLGFGSQLNENGWVYPVSAVTGLIAKENVIATFSVLAQATTENQLTASKYLDLYILQLDADGVSASIQMTNSTGVTWQALIAFIVFNMTTIPCFAAVATAKGELSKKKFWTTIGFWLATSYIAAMSVYLILSWWWTVFIFAGIVGGTSFGIYFYNSKKDKQGIV